MDTSNVCEHGDHPAPPGKRFCSRACEQCEHTEHDAERDECAGLCHRDPDPAEHTCGCSESQRYRSALEHIARVSTRGSVAARIAARALQ